MEIIDNGIDVTNWFYAPINEGVVSIDGAETDEFIKWKNNQCKGRVLIQPENIDESSSNYVKIPKWYVYFEFNEDYVLYLFTFEERKKSKTIDVAAYYCPYIPISFSSVCNSSVSSGARIVTRYDIKD